MPLISVTPPTIAGATSANPSVAVSLGWAGAGRSIVPAALLWLTSRGRVTEADLWPPIVRHQSLPVRGITTAWSLVRAGKAPIALQANVAGPFPGGTGKVNQVSIIQVLVTPHLGAPHLVPAYKFGGIVHLDAVQGVHQWYALVPAAGR
jgi:hypothetical protein